MCQQSIINIQYLVIDNAFGQRKLQNTKCRRITEKAISHEQNSSSFLLCLVIVLVIFNCSLYYKLNDARYKNVSEKPDSKMIASI